MAIDVECHQCSHVWTVPTAKAGRSVYCPECDESVEVPRPKTERPGAQKPERLPPGYRPRTDTRAKDKALFFGAVVLLGGVLAVVAMRIGGVMSDPNLEFDATPVTDLTDKLSGKSSSDSAKAENSEATGGRDGMTVAADTSDQSSSEAASPVGEGVSAADTTADSKRQQQLASLSEIAIDLDNFAPDVRGVISNVVETAATSAMGKCRLTPNDSVEPVMQLGLELKSAADQEELWLTAQLTASPDASPVVLWKRTGPLGTITEQAFQSGIVPPGIDREVATFFDREVATFFDELRAELVMARRNFPQDPKRGE